METGLLFIFLVKVLKKNNSKVYSLLIIKKNFSMSKLIPKTISIKNSGEVLPSLKMWLKSIYEMIEFHLFCSLLSGYWFLVENPG